MVATSKETRTKTMAAHSSGTCKRIDNHVLNSNSNAKNHNDLSKADLLPRFQKRERFPIRCLQYGLAATFFALELWSVIEFWSIISEPHDTYGTRALSGIYHEKYSELSDMDDGRYNCTIPRFHIDDIHAVGMGSNIGPVLLEGWQLTEAAWTQSSFDGVLGEYPQYLKDLTVQPYQKSVVQKSKHDNMCVLQTRDVVEVVLQRDDVLLFTNDKENEPFLNELAHHYEIPKIVQHITGFKVFSAFGKHRYHSMHAHGESWLGQVAGRRMWWFLPPSTTPKPARVDACDYLRGRQQIPADALRCPQRPGEIIWFPKDWFHATCALDDWNAGIGAQQGRTIRQNFPELASYRKELATAAQDGLHERHKKETLDACGLSKR